LPLPEPIILEVLSGTRHETKISTDEIETYERNGGYTLLAESVVTDPDHPEQLDTLLRHLTDYWCKQYPDRYITKIYAHAESRHGGILIQKLFLAPLENLAPNAYVLNMARPGASRFVRQFQECIERKKHVNSDSKAGEKQRTKVDISGQIGIRRKKPTRLASHVSQ